MRKTIGEVSELIGVPYATIYKYMRKSGQQPFVEKHVHYYHTYQFGKYAVRIKLATKPTKVLDSGKNYETKKGWITKKVETLSELEDVQDLEDYKKILANAKPEDYVKYDRQEFGKMQPVSLGCTLYEPPTKVEKPTLWDKILKFFKLKK